MLVLVFVLWLGLVSVTRLLVGLVPGFSCLSSGCLWCFRFAVGPECFSRFVFLPVFVGFVFPLAWSNQFGLRSAVWIWLGGVVCFPVLT